MLKLIFAALFFVCAQVHASLLIEPIMGYSMGNFKTRALTTQTEQNARIDGFTYGGRLGWVFGNGFFIGGEYQAGRMNFKLDGTDDAINWSNETIFGELGYELPMGLRVFAGMNVQPHKSELSTTPLRTEYTGSAKKLGIGYQYRIPLAMNAEYILYDLDEYKIGSTEGKMKSLYEKRKYDAIMLSISFPFSF